MWLYLHLPIYLTQLPIYFPHYLLSCLLIYLLVCLSICLSIYLPVCLSIYISLSLSLSLPLPRVAIHIHCKVWPLSLTNYSLSQLLTGMCPSYWWYSILATFFQSKRSNRFLKISCIMLYGSTGTFQRKMEAKNIAIVTTRHLKCSSWIHVLPKKELQWSLQVGRIHALLQRRPILPTAKLSPCSQETETPALFLRAACSCRLHFGSREWNLNRALCRFLSS